MAQNRPKGRRIEKGVRGKEVILVRTSLLVVLAVIIQVLKNEPQTCCKIQEKPNKTNMKAFQDTIWYATSNFKSPIMLQVSVTFYYSPGALCEELARTEAPHLAPRLNQAPPSASDVPQNIALVSNEY
jgi:hypothetical protein